MKKNKKIDDLQIGNLYAVELINKTWGLIQLCYIHEVEDICFLTYALFDVNEASISTLKNIILDYDLTSPFIVATLSERPLKGKWVLLGNRPVNYQNVDLKKNITGTWGWYKNKESGLFPKFESYLGILPWDLYIGKAAIENYLVSPTKKPLNVRYLKDFTKKEIEQLGLLKLIEYANRLDELKKE